MRAYLVFILFFACSCQNENETIKVATSANMQYAMEEIVVEFEKTSDVNVELIVSSSGKLTAQIEQGAPFDVFISANLKYPKSLYDKGLTNNEPEVYASGKLVLLTYKNIEPSLSILSSNQIDKIAIANPEIAPYGKAAEEVLMANGIYDLIEDKLVFAESISQVNQFVSTGNADVGFTAMSAVLSKEMEGKGSWIELDEKQYNPILQGAVILKNSTNEDDVKSFYDFLFTQSSKDILVNYGYTIDE